MCAQPKARPKLLDKREAKADVVSIDRAERAKCKARSGGRCEVVEEHPNPWSTRSKTLKRCPRVVGENHHLIGGIGRRNRGKSILAAHRLDVCIGCHVEITGKVLVPAVEQDKAECAVTVRYTRVR